MRKLKTLNLSNNVATATFVIFPSMVPSTNAEKMFCQLEMAIKALKMVKDENQTSVAYYHNESTKRQGISYNFEYGD